MFPLDPQALIPEEAYIPSCFFVEEHDTKTHESVATTAVRGTTPAVDEKRSHRDYRRLTITAFTNRSYA